MASVYQVNGHDGQFAIINRGAKNVRVQNLTTKETFLVPTETLSPHENAPAQVSCSDKFKMLERLVKVVVHGHSNGLFLTGPGGTGKTYTVMTTLAAMGKEEGRDYAVCKGYTTPAGLFKFLSANRDKIVIFDDCDSVFKDATGLNILKAVLDTYPTRVVSWNTSEGVDGENTFAFTGRIIFVSNLDQDAIKSNHLKAVITRVLSLQLGATKEDVLLRMQDLIPTICQAHDESVQAEIREFILENAAYWAKPSLRLLVNIAGLVTYARQTGDDWRDLALAIEC